MHKKLNIEKIKQKILIGIKIFEICQKQKVNLYLGLYLNINNIFLINLDIFQLPLMLILQTIHSPMQTKLL